MSAVTAAATLAAAFWAGGQAAPTAVRGTDYVLDYSDLGGKPYTVGFDSRSIRFNGKPATLLSGSIHYPRSTPSMWPSLFQEARAAGLNTIESYVFWNYHQRELADYTDGRYDYSGRGNVTLFLQLAKEADLFVIWRFGPYVCAEWPGGGMPSWLGQVPGDHPRSPTPVWEKVVGKWAADHFAEIAPFLAKNGGNVVMTQAENEYSCRASDPTCAAYMESLHDLAVSLDTGLLWENCHGTVAPGMIGAGNGCGGVAPAVGNRVPRSTLPRGPGDFNDSSTFPAMITEDEQWFDAWGYANVERSPTNVAYGVAAFVGSGAAMHNYYMFHGGNHYGNWSLFAETDNNTDTTPIYHRSSTDRPAPAPAYTAYSTSVRGVGGPESASNTVRYANAAPLHSDGTRNEPRFSHLAAFQNLVRAHAGVMLTTNGSLAPADDGPAGCVGLPGYAHNPVARIQCVVYGANTTDEITFAIGGNGGSVSPPLNASAPLVPTQMASIYGVHLGFPGDGNHQATVAVIAADRKTVLWNSSDPTAVDLSKHRIVPDPAAAALKTTSWQDAARTWYRAEFVTPAGSPVATLVDLAGMAKGMAFVNGQQIANYDASVGNCTRPFPQLVHWKPKGWCGRLDYINGGGAGPNSTTDTYPDGGCGQPSQRYYHIPPDWMAEAGGDNTLLLGEHVATRGSDPSAIRIVTRN